METIPPTFPSDSTTKFRIAKFQEIDDAYVGAIADAIAKNKDLQSVNIECFSGVTDSSLFRLAKAVESNPTALHTLYIDATHAPLVTDASVRRLFEALRVNPNVCALGVTWTSDTNPKASTDANFRGPVMMELTREDYHFSCAYRHGREYTGLPRGVPSFKSLARPHRARHNLAMLAFVGAHRPDVETHPPVWDFLNRDGDCALQHRVMNFLIFDR